ncbi:IS607 family transposase [Natranaerobius trueperi]|uniref:IS607 family transposase n=1 Tax=Natranaerobius trueperi TaxID=759412 RepID=UPI002690D193
MYLSIKEAAAFLGVAESTLRRWENEDKLTPERTSGGHRRYSKDSLIAFKDKKDNNKLTIGYCRVSSSDQKEDLKRQVENVTNYCIANGYQFRIIEDLGSGLNYKKKGLKELLAIIENRDVERIVVNYKDRLMRFGYEVLEEICKLNNVDIEIINHSEDKTYEEELVDDVLSVITVFSSRLYGSRSRKTKEILKTNKQMFT